MGGVELYMPPEVSESGRPELEFVLKLREVSVARTFEVEADAASTKALHPFETGGADVAVDHHHGAREPAQFLQRIEQAPVVEPVNARLDQNSALKSYTSEMGNEVVR